CLKGCSVHAFLLNAWGLQHAKRNRACRRGPCDQRKECEVQPLEAVFIGRPYDITSPPSTREEPNATRQALAIAGAKHERRLLPVACTRFIGKESCFQ